LQPLVVSLSNHLQHVVSNQNWYYCS